MNIHIKGSWLIKDFGKDTRRKKGIWLFKKLKQTNCLNLEEYLKENEGKVGTLLMWSWNRQKAIYERSFPLILPT